MFFYKQISFDFQESITAKLLDIAREFNPNMYMSVAFNKSLLEERIPELVDQFNNKQLEVDIFREFVSSPHRGLGIHQDGSPGWPKHLALNWPIEHCANTKMVWWNFSEEPVLSDDAYNYDVAFPSSVLKIYKQDRANAVEQCEIITPTLVNINHYHSVVNGPNYRRMISFRFNPEPWHLIQ